MSIPRSRLKKGKESIIDGYRNASIIREVIDCLPFIEEAHSSENYFQIGLRTLTPKDWFRDVSVYLDLTEIGRIVAMGEQNFLIRKIQEKSRRSEVKEIEKFTFDKAVRAIEEIKDNGYSPSILYVPIEFYVEMHKWKLPYEKRTAIQYPSGRRGFFVPDQFTTLKIFWSNKYIPLDKILVFDRSFAKWIVKTEPETGDFIRVMIKDSEEPDKFEITAKTVVRFILREPDALRILSPTYIPKME